jgi:hypothetical protein
MGERRSLSHSFLLGLNHRDNKKREARTQLFIIDPVSVSILFYLTRLPCENNSIGPWHKEPQDRNPIIMSGFPVASKKRIKMYFLATDSFFPRQTGLFPKIMPLLANNIFDVCRQI